jgi:hypothetical protein
MKTKKFLLGASISILAVGSIYADPLVAKWYTQSLTVHQGDDVKINLFVYPEKDHPVVTVSNSLVYNPKMLDFEDSVFGKDWVRLPTKPYDLTDETLGMVRRTAGFMEGTSEPTQYVTYTFKALKPGVTTLSLEDGMALDTENVDIGLTPKTLQINILGDAPKVVKEPEPAEDVPTEPLTNDSYDDIFADKVVNITMDTDARAAMFEGEDYTFQVNLNQLPVTDDAGEIDLSLLDAKGNLVYSKVDYFRPHETAKTITIPKEAFVEGQYVLKIDTVYKNLGNSVETTKQIGVLKKPQEDNIWNFLITYWKYFIGAFGLLILIVLHHIHKEHEMMRAMRARYRNTIRVVHRK